MEITNALSFKQQIKQGIPNELPSVKEYETTINHAPKRKAILSDEEKNARGIFPPLADN